MRLVKAIGAAAGQGADPAAAAAADGAGRRDGARDRGVDGDPEPRALAVAAELAALPRLAVELAKKAADGAEDASREAALLIEQLAYAALAEAGGTQAVAVAAHGTLGSDPVVALA